MIYKFLLFTILCVVSTFSYSLECVVTNIVDGDTIDAQCENAQLRVRILGLEAYETTLRFNRAYKQAYLENISVEEVVKRGKEGRKLLHELLNGKLVEIITNEKDIYNRSLGNVFIIINDKKVNVSDYMIKSNPILFKEFN